MSEPFLAQIGHAVGRAEGPAKVTGAAQYPADVRRPGMLVGRCLRSPFAHARIVAIDTRAARTLPGVHAVLTGADLPPVLVGRFLRDLPVLARERVLFVGQKVAAVAAETNDIAEQALALIEVAYEELDAVFDPFAAMLADAPVLHPDFDSYVGRADGRRAAPNIVASAHWGKGDIEAGFAASHRVIEHTFRTQRQHQGYIEPHACVVDIDVAGRVQVWVNSKGPFQTRQQMALGIDVPEQDIVVNASYIGGDFGGKGDFMDTHLAYFLARQARRPVRMVMSYTEELIAGNPRHAAVMTFRTGVSQGGAIIARSAELLFDSGAFGAFRPGKGATYGPRCLGPYRMQHSRIESSLVYTNQVPCGSMRSPGDPQSIFASEAHIDLVARELGMDPLEFRLANLVRDGEENAVGRRWRNPVMAQLLRRAAEESGYGAPRRNVAGRAVGIGVAICERGTGGGNGTARVSIDAQGSVTLSIALRDTGAGVHTVLRQIVGETLGVAFDSIALHTWDTDAIATEGAIGGARVTNAGGNAALVAAGQVRDALAALAAQAFGWNDATLRFRDGAVHNEAGVAVPLARLMRQHGATIVAEHTYNAPATPDETVFTAQAAEVEVDLETGAVRVHRFTSVHDVGTVLNPIAHQGQIDGSIAQGLGYTLMEELIYEEGHVLNAHLGDYKLPTLRDMPLLNTVLVRAGQDGPAPYGGKAIGEQAISGVAPAIVNAILDATGVSLRELPVTAERVFAKLAERNS